MYCIEVFYWKYSTKYTHSHANMFVTLIFAFFLQVILPNQCCIHGLVLLMNFSSLNNIIGPISTDIHLQNEANEKFHQEIHSLHLCVRYVCVCVCSYKYRSCISNGWTIAQLTRLTQHIVYTIYGTYIVLVY